MTDTDEPHDSYDETRRNFDDLDAEERARFLVEATASTLAHGLLQAGEVLADGLEEAIRRARRRADGPNAGREPGAAEPETAQRQAPRNGSHESDPEA